MKKLSILILSFGLAFFVNAQQPYIESSNSDKIAPSGTYQIQILASDSMQLFLKLDVAKRAENLRDSRNDRYLQLNNSSRLFIPSKSKISNSSFQRLPELIYVERFSN